MRGCVSRGSLPGGVQHAVTRALLRVLPQERARRACVSVILLRFCRFSRNSESRSWDPRVPTLGETSASPRALCSFRGSPDGDRSRIGSATGGIALLASTGDPRLPRVVYVCLRVHGREIRSDTREDPLEVPVRAVSGCPT